MWTWTKKLTVLASLGGFVLSAAPVAEAQIVFGQPAAGNLQLIYHHWKIDTEFGEATMDQLMIPLSGFVPVRDNFDLTFFVANASTTYNALDTEYKLSGLGDFRLQANHSFLNDQLLASATVSLPTGKKELDSDQTAVLIALSQNFLEVPMRQFGEGFGFSLLIGGARELKKGLRVGAGAVYRYVGEYTPYERIVSTDSVINSTTVSDYEGYDPGDVIGLNGGVDYERGSMLWSADMVFTQYSADQLNSVKTFRQSRQFDWRLRGTYVTESISFAGLARYVWRGKNRIYDTSGAWIATPKLFGNEFSLSGELTYFLTEKWYAAPSIDFRQIAGIEITDMAEVGSSNMLGFGIAAGGKFTGSMDARLGFKLSTGSADGGNIDVSGYQVTFALTGTL